jgi:hypothetical protein
VHYTSKDDAVNEYRQKRARGDPKLLQGLQIAGNPLPASFQVKAKDPKKLDSIIAITNQPEFKAMLDPTAPAHLQRREKPPSTASSAFSNFFTPPASSPVGFS